MSVLLDPHEEILGFGTSIMHGLARAIQGSSDRLTFAQSSTPIEVTVLLDGQPVRDIARTEINTSTRATRRTVLAGAGTTF